MTDFLTDLLERSRGHGAALSPRIPSVFEPPPADTSRPAWADSLWPAGEDAVTSAAEDAVGPAALDTIRLAAQAPVASAERMPAGRRPQPSPPAAARPEGQLPAPSRATPPAPAHIPARIPARTPARVPARTEGGEIGHQPTGQPAMLRAGSAVPPAAAAAETAPDRATVTVPQPGPAGHRPAVAGRLAGVSRAGDQRVPPLQIQPDTTERAGPGALPPPAAHVGELLPPRPGLLTVPQPGVFAVPPVPAGPVGDPVPPPEPTVHVTIGRVEIRAVAARAPAARPAPAARSAPAARAMSLDEYLAERNQRRQS